MANIFKGTRSYKSTEARLQDQGRDREIPKAPPSSGDRFKAAFSDAFKIGTQGGRNLLETTRERDQIRLHQEHNTGVFSHQNSLLDSTAAVQFGVTDGKDILRKNEARIRELQKEFPNAGFKTAQEVDDDILREQGEILRKNRELSAASSGFDMGDIAAFAGYVTGFLADPANALSAAVGGGAVAGKAGLSAIRVGASEAAIESALLLKDKPGELEVRRKLGEEITPAQVAAEVGISIGAAGVLGGAIGALFSKFAPVGTPANPVSQKTIDMVKRARKGISDGSIRESAELSSHLDMLDETAQILARTPEDSTQIQHTKDYVKAREDLANGRDVDVTGRSHEDEAGGNPPQMPENTVELQTQQDTVISAAKQRLDVEDIELKVTDEQGNVIESRSARQLLREAEQAEKAAKAIDQCMLGGGNVTE